MIDAFHPLIIHPFHILKVRTLVQDYGLKLGERLVDSIPQDRVRSKVHLRILLDDNSLTRIHIYALTAVHRNQLKSTQPLDLDNLVCLKELSHQVEHRTHERHGVFL